jgi:hypothetical protein
MPEGQAMSKSEKESKTEVKTRWQSAQPVISLAGFGRKEGNSVIVGGGKSNIFPLD